MIKVLFVCMGNICRSPMAEAIFANLVKQAGLSDQFEIDSAGTIGHHAGNPAHPGTRQILKQHQIDYVGRSRQVTVRDLAYFDYVLAMDSDNLYDLQHLANTDKVQRLLDFADQVTERNVPDPYYDGNFRHTYGLILAGCQGLLAHIQAEHKL